MKKILVVTIAVLALFSLVACGGIATDTPETKEKETTSQLPDSTVSAEQASTVQAPETGVRAEFKEAMVAYESFYSEYCAFMKKYKENPTDMSILSEYTAMASKAVDMSSAFEEWDQSEMNSEELKYYLEVSARVTQMLAEIA